mgnify:CR=1 FL=1
MIKTDGISVSVLFIKLENGKPMSKIKGIYAASMSIFNKNLSLNIEKTLAHAEKIIEQGCHGAVIFGSTKKFKELTPMIS